MDVNIYSLCCIIAYVCSITTVLNGQFILSEFCNVMSKLLVLFYVVVCNTTDCTFPLTHLGVYCRICSFTYH